MAEHRASHSLSDSSGFSVSRGFSTASHGFSLARERAKALARNPLIGPLLIGVATGGRTSVGLAALAWSGPSGDATPPVNAHDTTRHSNAPSSTLGSPLSWFRRRWSKPAQSAALIGELIIDKLPSTASRLEPPGLALRIASGSTSATALAQRNADPIWPAVAVGALGAVAGSLIGARWRALAARRGRSDFGPALLEDAVALAIAVYACRPRPAATETFGAAAENSHRIDLTQNVFAAQPQVN